MLHEYIMTSNHLDESGAAVLYKHLQLGVCATHQLLPGARRLRTGAVLLVKALLHQVNATAENNIMNYYYLEIFYSKHIDLSIIDQ